MAEDVQFDSRELDVFSKAIMDLAQTQMPKECKKFIRLEGNKLKRVVTKNAKAKIKQKTGRYHKAATRGKVYKYNGAWAVRVYAKAPHANLLEHGHRIVINGTETGKMTKGLKIYENSAKEFSSKYFDNTEKFIDKITKGI